MSISTMGDEANKTAVAKSDWTATFVTKLCAIAWFGAMFGEVLPRGVLKFVCILFGSHAAVIALLTCLIVWPLRRQAIFFVLLIATAAPTAYFAVVMWRVAKLRGWIDGGSA